MDTIHTLTLITNVQHAAIKLLDHERPTVSCGASALVFTDETLCGERRCTVRGFRVDAANEMFSIRTLTASPERVALPCSTREAYIFAEDGLSVTIQPAQSEQAFDIKEHSDYETLWQDLQRRSIRYWGPPNLPLLAWSRADDVRASYG